MAFAAVGLWAGQSRGAGTGGTLRLEFRTTAGEKALELSRTPVTLGGRQAVLSRADWIVSGLAIQRADGTWTEGANWYGAIRGGKGGADADGVPAGEYKAIRFHVGVSPADNASDPAKRPAGHALHPDVCGLHWGWQGGYIFMALEGTREDGAGFSYHVANDPQLMTVETPVRFQGGGPVTVSLEFDAQAALDAADPAREGGGLSTHSRPGDPTGPRLKAAVERAFRARGVSYDLFQTADPAAPAPQAAVAPPKGTTPYDLALSERLPRVALPADNPLTREGVELGRRLFHETRLSSNATQSCASCHDRGAAFAEPRAVSTGADGHMGKRNAMPLFNLAWATSFFWDGRAPTLRAQALEPLRDAHELNLPPAEAVKKLAADKSHAAEFAAAFGSPGVTEERLGLALEQFLLTLVSQDSRYDRAARKREKLTPQEARGLRLFVTEYDPARGMRGADCFHCHGGNLFTDQKFHDNGLTLAPGDTGRGAVTGDAADDGKFKTPSLRNVALTAPYMHDGRFATLEEVVDHYSGPSARRPNLDPNLAKHPAQGIRLTPEEKSDLIAFLKTLTDDGFAADAPSSGIAREP